MADWGISSNGRAPALHAGGTGIDARILHKGQLPTLRLTILTGASSDALKLQQ